MLNKYSSGYTLLEVMIALFIFALLSSIATVSLKSLIDNSQALSEQAKQQRLLIQSVHTIKADLENIIETKTPGTPMLVGTNTSLEFTRLSQECIHSPCPPLERITYRFRYPILTRMVTSIGIQEKFSTQTLFKPVHEIHFQFVNKQNQVVNSWPVDDQTPLPAAIKITLDEVTIIVSLL